MENTNDLPTGTGTLTVAGVAPKLISGMNVGKHHYQTNVKPSNFLGYKPIGLVCLFVKGTFSPNPLLPP
jgi:hypothetical protein